MMTNLKELEVELLGFVEEKEEIEELSFIEMVEYLLETADYGFHGGKKQLAIDLGISQMVLSIWLKGKQPNLKNYKRVLALYKQVASS